MTESLLTRDKNYDFIVANNDDMILGALQVVRQFKLGRKIRLIGVDGLPEALEAIQKGELDATVFQDPEGQGGGGIWGYYLALSGVKLPKDILIPFRLVTTAIHSLRPVSPHASIRCLAFAIGRHDTLEVNCSSE